jgi:hypothetical protein
MKSIKKYFHGIILINLIIFNLGMDNENKTLTFEENKESLDELPQEFLQEETIKKKNLENIKKILNNPRYKNIINDDKILIWTQNYLNKHNSYTYNGLFLTILSKEKDILNTIMNNNKLLLNQYLYREIGVPVTSFICNFTYSDNDSLKMFTKNNYINKILDIYEKFFNHKDEDDFSLPNNDNNIFFRKLDLSKNQFSLEELNKIQSEFLKIFQSNLSDKGFIIDYNIINSINIYFFCIILINDLE